MASREVVLGYIEQMIAIENKMEARYRDLAARVDRPEYRDELTRMSGEEAEHAKVLWDLLKELGQ